MDSSRSRSAVAHSAQACDARGSAVGPDCDGYSPAAARRSRPNFVDPQMSLTPESVTVFHPVFNRLTYDPNAERSVHLQAGGFVWSDETPDFRTEGTFPIPITRFMICLISYRTTLIRGLPHEPFTPCWQEFKRCCPDWPGFRPERSDPGLVDDLDRELDREYDRLERRLKICERKKGTRYK